MQRQEGPVPPVVIPGGVTTGWLEPSRISGGSLECLDMTSDADWTGRFGHQPAQSLELQNDHFSQYTMIASEDIRYMRANSKQ